MKRLYINTLLRKALLLGLLLGIAMPANTRGHRMPHRLAAAKKQKSAVQTNMDSMPIKITTPALLSAETDNNDEVETDTLIPVKDSMPSSFLFTKENTITRAEKLDSFFSKLTGKKEPARIVHLGDSHLRGHILPLVIRHRLETAWGDQAVRPDHITYRTDALATETGNPGFVYHAWGKNGATCSYFCVPQRIARVKSLKPDVIILSFGTNEAHVRRYNADQHLNTLSQLVNMLQAACPQATIMLTTPQGAYYSYRVAHYRTVRKNRRTVTRRYFTYYRTVNKNTQLAVNTINSFAEKNDLPVWDLYNIAGGSGFACLNWVGGNYMKGDRIHFTAAGYTLQGNLLSQAMIKAYNQYITRKKGNGHTIKH